MLEGLGTAFMLVLYFLLDWFYPVAFELGRDGATPGKSAMGLKVVMDNGLPVTPAASMMEARLAGRRALSRKMVNCCGGAVLKSPVRP